jgi:hypothetical protein
MTSGIEDAGFDIRDQIMWVFGSGFPKSHNLDPFSIIETRRTFERWGTALKPAHEPICFARKPFNSSVADNVVRNGVGALNIAACRVSENQDGHGRQTSSMMAVRKLSTLFLMQAVSKPR